MMGFLFIILVTLLIYVRDHMSKKRASVGILDYFEFLGHTGVRIKIESSYRGSMVLLGQLRMSCEIICGCLKKLKNAIIVG